MVGNGTTYYTYCCARAKLLMKDTILDGENGQRNQIRATLYKITKINVLITPLSKSALAVTDAAKIVRLRLHIVRTTNTEYG